MRINFATFIVLMLCAGGASGQIPATAGRAKTLDVGAGYTYINHSSGQSNRVGLSGVDGNVTIGLYARMGIKADVSYARSGNLFGTPSHSSVLTYMGGPVFHPIAQRNLAPYVHVLLGGARVTGPVLTNTGIMFGGWATGFAWAVGGGVDYRISDAMALRTGADFLRTRYYGPSLTLQGQSNIRITASVAYFFGTQPRRRR